MTEPSAPPEDSEKPGRLARGGTILSLLACYGTLAVVAGLSALGVTIAINDHVWAAAIVIFAVVAVLGVGFGARRHGNTGQHIFLLERFPGRRLPVPVCARRQVHSQRCANVCRYGKRLDSDDRVGLRRRSLQ